MPIVLFPKKDSGQVVCSPQDTGRPGWFVRTSRSWRVASLPRQRRLMGHRRADCLGAGSLCCINTCETRSLNLCLGIFQSQCQVVRLNVRINEDIEEAALELRYLIYMYCDILYWYTKSLYSSTVSTPILVCFTSELRTQKFQGPAIDRYGRVGLKRGWACPETIRESCSCSLR